jgi:hypothetical protein
LYITYYIAKSLNNFGLKGIILFFGGLKGLGGYLSPGLGDTYPPDWGILIPQAGGYLSPRLGDNEKARFQCGNALIPQPGG